MAINIRSSPYDTDAQTANIDDDSDQSDFEIPEDAFLVDGLSDPPIDLTGPGPANTSQYLFSYHYHGHVLRINQLVELSDGDFLLIRHITQHLETNQVLLEGHLFRRTFNLKGLLEKKKNELVWIQRYNPNKLGDIWRQSLQRVQINRVIRPRELILTNHRYPTGSYRDDASTSRLDDEVILRSCQLTCRWKYLAHSEKEGSLVALNLSEAEHWFYIKNEDLKNTWRGITMKGGSCPGWLTGEKEFDNKERPSTPDIFDSMLEENKSGQRYTFGDGFCGAGGVSRGAKAAGLRVQWSFDHDKKALDSYCLNFYETLCYNCSANDFITIIPDELKIDVVHLSFPCQPFSPAHTRPGANDEQNEASFFSLEGILERTKPRVVMIEETFGLLRTANRMQWFRSMIQVFTKQVFSVRWKIFNLLEYGLPGRRQRLFVFASCPGEPLPSFPQQTHSSRLEQWSKPHLLRYRTINDAISQIPAGEPLTHSKPCNEPGYNGDVPLPNAICCSRNSSKHASSRMIHPSGARTFSSREIACLNGFPIAHKFDMSKQTDVRKQIGNAVPPLVAKIFLEEIVKSLRRADGLH